MTTPTYCIDCGHELGIGRFCTNCGRPVPGRHPEAMPPVDAPTAPRATPPIEPPSASQLPPSARYPLYAEAPPTERSPAPPPVMPAPAPVRPPAPSYDAPGSAPAWLPWVIALVVLAIVAGVGAFLLIGGGDETAADGRDDQTGETVRPADSGTDGPEKPDSTGTGAPADAPDPEDVVDLTSEVSADVPAVAPPSRDRQNEPVSFVAANMWDGRPRTAWRMAGDGSGETLTFRLGTEVVLTEVGMINGYAKVDGPINWYSGNRRVRAVQWEFDDGTRITQEFADKQTLQMAMIGPVRTSTVKVHLITVTEPGQGANGRDFTAISEVRFLGAPG